MDSIFLTRADLKKWGINISNTTMLRLEAKGQLPKRRYLTPRTVVWNRAEIDEFTARLFESNDDNENR